ncbi:MAG: NUDIX domain-containing protein [Alicyclobacillus sp.]|nr:NUDIX domain-containing protein [Alicyclobacillus sp.]
MRDYIKNLRKLLGSQPVLQCGATVIVFDSHQRVLMLRRTDNRCWCFPGGSIELGEQLEETARREVFEEAGVHVGALHLLQVFSGEELYYQYPNGDEVYNVDVVYYTSEFHGDVMINEESSEYAFFDIHDIPNDVSPPQRPVVEYLKMHNPFQQDPREKGVPKSR